jgi:hypothetical protein
MSHHLPSGGANLGQTSETEKHLIDRIEKDVARLSGVEVPGDRTRPWSSIVLGLVIGLPSAYWFYCPQA